MCLPVFAALAAAGTKVVVAQRWDTSRVCMLTLGPDSFEQLEPKLREFFCLPADQQCKIYYCTDRKQPRATRIEVNATSWHTFWLSVKAHKDTWLVMHVLPQPRPGCPEREPHWLKVDTGREILAEKKVRKAAQPRKRPRIRNPLLRPATLARDYDGRERLSYCVFCGVRLPAALLQTDLLVPAHGRKERDLLFLPFKLLTHALLNCSETTLNTVTTCPICHMLFDEGLLWTDLPPDAAPTAATVIDELLWNRVDVATLVVRVDPRLRNQHCRALNGRRLRVPAGRDTRLPFAPVWEWRRRWATIRRECSLASDALRLLGLCDTHGCSHTVW